MERKPILCSLISLALLAGSCSEKKPQATPLEVAVTKVVQQDVKIKSEFTGQTFGESDIQINPQVTGIVQKLAFKEGGMVQKGQLLYIIDPLPYRAQVNEAQAELAQAQADMSKAKSDLDMIEPLAKINAVSQREFVAAKANYEAASAKIKACEAMVDNAKIELGYCSITSPINGIIGISKVRVGDYVRQGDFNTLNTVSDLKTIRVRFTISEQEYLRVYKDVTSDSSTLKGVGQSIELQLSDGSYFPTIGKLNFTDRQIDPSTGAMTFEAVFANTNTLLRPGQYVKVHVVTNVRKNALVIPQRAVIEMQGISQVYVVDDSSKVRVRIIKPGPAFMDAYVVEEGLTVNDKIAFGGTNLLRNGSLIKPQMADWQPSLPNQKK